MGTFLRFPEGRTRALTFSYDDGGRHDVRLVKILAAHGLRGTFNLNSGLFGIGTRLTAAAVADLYLPAGQEIACHMLNHCFPDKTSRERILYEIMEDRRRLEALTGGVVRGMAYPYGTYNDETLAALRAADIAYARTVISTRDFRLPTDWLQLTATCHHNDPELPALADRFLSADVTKSDHNRQAQLFYLWGHSSEFENNGNWQVIEDFAAKMSGNADIWYATNGEIYDYITAYHRLHYSLEGTRAYNPSALPVWIEHDKQLYCIPAGETVAL